MSKRRLRTLGPRLATIAPRFAAPPAAKNPSAARRLTGRRLQDLRLMAIGERVATCQRCNLVHLPVDLVLHHDPPLHTLDADPLLHDPEWRSKVLLLCVECHDAEHNAKPAIGLDGWPIG